MGDISKVMRRRYDGSKYKLCMVVERFFNRRKHYCRGATRYDETDLGYLGFVCLVSLIATVP